MLRELFPNHIAISVATPAMYGASVFAEERAVVERSVPKRQQEFAAGRAAARQAIAALGGPDVAILTQSDRSPVWPTGFVGSITHCHGFCGAVAAHRKHVTGLGVDAEPIASFSPEMEELLFGDDERASFTEMPKPPVPNLSWATVAFCAKEAFYKSYFPRTNQFLEFQDVVVNLRLHEHSLYGGFSVRLRANAVATVQENSRFWGRWSVGHGLVLAGAAVPAGSD